MNVYIAKMTVPDPQTATVPSEPWPATTDKQTQAPRCPRLSGEDVIPTRDIQKTSVRWKQQQQYNRGRRKTRGLVYVPNLEDILLFVLQNQSHRNKRTKGF